MARYYKASFEGVAVSGAQDLFELEGGAGKFIRVLRVHIGCTDTTAPTNQQLELRARYLPATVSHGTGGSTPTICKTDPGDGTAAGVVLANNTSKATTNGTAVVLAEWGVNIFGGFDEEFARPIPLMSGESYVFELLSTVSGTVHLSGMIEWSEEGA